MPPLHHMLWTTVRQTVAEWLDRGVFHWGAALAYYSLISLTPALLLGVTGIGRLVGRATTKEQVIEQAGFLLGPNAQSVVAQVVNRLSALTFDSLWVVPTTLLLAFGATAFFANIQVALNDIWGLQPKTGVIRNVIRTRVMAAIMLFALAVALVLSVGLSALGQFVLRFLPPPVGEPVIMGQLVEVGVTLTVLTLLLSLTFMVLPDARIEWRDVLVGSFVTALLLYIGKLLLGLYMGRADLGSAFGAAGSVFTLLVWIYYSAQIFLVGAIFTRTWADLHGATVRPESYATIVERREVPTPGLGDEQRSAEAT